MDPRANSFLVHALLTVAFFERVQSVGDTSFAQKFVLRFGHLISNRFAVDILFLKYVPLLLELLSPAHVV